jgi:two-component sensor histidine kinase
MKALYFFLMLFPAVCFAQNEFNQKKVDSLLAVLSTKKQDTSKVALYQLICEQYQFSNPAKIVFYNAKILQISKQANYEKGIGYYYLNQKYLFANDLSSSQMLPLMEKAAKIFLKVKDYNYYLTTQYYIAEIYTYSGYPIKATAIIKKTIPIATSRKSVNNNLIGNLYVLLGQINYNDHSLSHALRNYTLALKYLSKEKNNENYKTALYLYIAFTNTDLGNFKNSLYYLNLADRKEESVPINQEKASVYNKLGQYNNALRILLQNKNLQMTKPESSYNTYLIAELYLSSKKYKAAIETVSHIENEKTNNIIKLNSYNILAQSYLRLQEYEKAKEWNEKAGFYASTTKNQESKLTYFLCKSEIEEATGNFKEALLSIKKHNALKEAKYLKQNADKINELETTFDLLQKDSHIKDLKLVSLQKNIQIHKQKNYIIGGILLIVLLLFGIVIFIFFFRIIKKKNNIIRIENSELECAKVQIEKSLQERELLLKEIHHRVKNNLQIILSLLSIQAKEGINFNNMDTFLEKSQSRIITISLIHQNLYENENLENIDYKLYVNDLIKNLDSILNVLNKRILFKINIEAVFFDLQTAIPLGLIINELVSNSYKHAFANRIEGEIEITIINKFDKEFTLTYSDNGIGFSYDETTAKKSLGLELIRLLTNQLKGKLSRRKVKEGTSYQIDFNELI